ncbi:MAG: ABC transporter ATP-binding protein [Chloroflexota bacterium]|nr:ABC transporter ATP-binding protein [Chloroflexota bacterium]
MPDDTPALRAAGLSRHYGGVTAVDDFSLQVDAGEFCAILGPSGSGKTTALRLIAGFERPDGGTLDLFGEPTAGGSAFVPPDRRDVGMVFQDYALFPHMNVAENVAYGLRGGTRSGRERRERVREVLDLTGLTDFAERGVHELSGGEQQRAALARALAPGPRMLLLDEPFSNLDASLRQRLRLEVREIIRRSGATAILVTHEQEEALSLADRVAFMWEGRVEQSGTPETIYREPETLRIATSIGDAIVLPCRAADGRVRSPFGEHAAPDAAGECVVVIRPEDVRIGGVGDPGVPGEVVERTFYGHDQMLRVRTRDGDDVRVRVGSDEEYERLGSVTLSLRREPRVFAHEPAEA